jgi:hypothetical protein
MKKMFLPENSIRQAMIKDGLTTKEIDLFFKAAENASSGKGDDSSEKNGKVGGAATKTNESSKVVEEEDKYEKWVKMLKILPPNVVKQKMLAAGITEAEVAAFFKKQGIDLKEEVVKKDKEVTEDEPPPGTYYVSCHISCYYFFTTCFAQDFLRKPILPSQKS